MSAQRERVDMPGPFVPQLVHPVRGRAPVVILALVVRGHGFECRLIDHLHWDGVVIISLHQFGQDECVDAGGDVEIPVRGDDGRTILIGKAAFAGEVDEGGDVGHEELESGFEDGIVCGGLGD